MDSLMDAMTNVVGVLLLILIVSSLGISAAVRKVVENLPEVSEEELQAMKESRDRAEENLDELRSTHQSTADNLPTDEEAEQLVAELEELEKNNEDLADKTSDIEAWKKKVEEAETEKEEREAVVLEADQRNRELAAILAQTPEPEVAAAREITMPNPRAVGKETVVHYFVCRGERLYYVGDPYEHAFRIRDVIDQNFSDLAYTGHQVGSYTYSIKDSRENRDGYYPAITESLRFSRRDLEDLSAWDSLKPKWADGKGEISQDRSVLQRIVDSDRKAEVGVAKFRFDFKKLSDFFGDGKLGPEDFSYHISRGGGDRVKFAIGFKEEGGWSREEFLAGNSEFVQLCKKASVNRGIAFYYYVAPDSFETYLEARDLSESRRVPAGWALLQGETFAPRAVPQRETANYRLDALPAEQYMALANRAGPALAKALDEEWSQFDQRVASAVPEELTDEAAKKEFIEKLGEERREWNRTRFQSYVLAPFRAALAAQEADDEAEIRLEIHPPEIPGIRIFRPASPPSKPPEPEPPGKPKPKGEPRGTPGLILD